LPHRRNPKKPSAPPVSSEWIYNEQAKTYAKGGRGITPRRIVEARNQNVTATLPGVSELSTKLTTGRINLQSWVIQMRTQIKDIYLQQYMLGRGGKAMMTPSDYGRVGALLKQQYAYLDNFAKEIAAGKLTPAQIDMRAKMYIESATQCYERARASARGLVLPVYPGDGQTACRVRCKCTWVIREDPQAWYCSWTLGIAEHCEDCLNLATRYRLYVVPKYR
jgi:hypothetical protein